MKKNKLVWRLGKLPSPLEVTELVKDKIITQEEAREVLFKTEVEEDGRDTDSYKEEIKFLRSLVEKLSANNRSTLVEYIYTKPWNYGWYQPYVTWCSTSNTLGSGSSAVNYSMNSLDGTNAALTYSNMSSSGLADMLQANYSTTTSTSFTDISTF